MSTLVRRIANHADADLITWPTITAGNQPRIALAVAAMCTAMTLATVVVIRYLGRVFRDCTLPAEDAYREGYETGHDRGYRDCETEQGGRRQLRSLPKPKGA